MGPVKKNLKATKKFEKKHLKGVLDNRKASAKVKQRHQIKDKKQARKAQDAEFYKGSKDGADGDASKPKGSKGRKVADMSVDDFFKGGFDDIIDKSPKLGKRKRDGPKADEDEGSFE
jgi:nucleolar complex protein 2